jgi:hypothetical protein
LPALESSHALAGAKRWASETAASDSSSARARRRTCRSSPSTPEELYRGPDIQPRDRIRNALARDLSAAGEPAKLVTFVTAGYPEPREFLNVLRSRRRDAVEIGMPFSDPIRQRDDPALEPAHRAAWSAWILDELRAAIRARGARAADELSEPAARVRRLVE